LAQNFSRKVGIGGDLKNVQNDVLSARDRCYDFKQKFSPHPKNGEKWFLLNLLLVFAKIV
jgi:hypothetical protein